MKNECVTKGREMHNFYRSANLASRIQQPQQQQQQEQQQPILYCNVHNCILGNPLPKTDSPYNKNEKHVSHIKQEGTDAIMTSNPDIFNAPRSSINSRTSFQNHVVHINQEQDTTVTSFPVISGESGGSTDTMTQHAVGGEDDQGVAYKPHIQRSAIRKNVALLEERNLKFKSKSNEYQMALKRNEVHTSMALGQIMPKKVGPATALHELNGKQHPSTTGPAVPILSEYGFNHSRNSRVQAPSSLKDSSYKSFSINQESIVKPLLDPYASIHFRAAIAPRGTIISYAPSYAPPTMAPSLPVTQIDSITSDSQPSRISTNIGPALTHVQSSTAPMMLQPGPKDAARKHVCDVCGVSFTRPSTFVTHKRIHTGDKPFECETCGRAFRHPSNLTRHRLIHTAHKPHVCPHCGKAFNRSSNLHIHLRTHSDVRMFTCQYCGKGFNQKGNLQAHVYRHTGERPFKCHICGKGFTLASTRTTHLRTHTNEKPFQCKYCEKSFNQKKITDIVLFPMPSRKGGRLFVLDPRKVKI
ncbi:zinc finger protein Gfi-1b-like [Nematostella vectensis]|uniref:zinc finger protein Gfi-1b-like n=1 Tax=Nematostella vectensis TaxID=45351 RepID=UPI0020773B51|nr:zinc finger protein Gfi-1b-like [Nematostella vectensis]